jgi:uncharacterized protein (DUF305 family)
MWLRSMIGHQKDDADLARLIPGTQTDEVGEMQQWLEEPGG